MKMRDEVTVDPADRTTNAPGVRGRGEMGVGTKREGGGDG